MARQLLGQLFLIVTVLMTISACSAKEKSPPMSLEEASHLKFRVSVEGVPFDVPVTYAHSEYVMFKSWPRVPKEQTEGKSRPQVDSVKITALLPDIEPYTEKNAAEFDKLGYGKKIEVHMSHRSVNWPYYFKHFFNRLKRLPDSPEVPAMLRYLDAVTKHEVFLSADKPQDDLIRIICHSQEFDSKPAPSPSCHVETVFLNRFEFSYSFHRNYLGQWREIDRKLKARYEEFIHSAQVRP